MKRIALFLLASCSVEKGAERPPSDLRRQAAQTPFFCRYQKNPFRLPAGSLAFGPEEAPVARLDEAKSREVGLELTLPLGDGQQPMKTVFTTSWVTFHGYYRPEKPLALYLIDPVQVGVLQLGRQTRLSYLGNAGGKMDVAVQELREFRPVKPLRLSLKCEETGIVAPQFNIEQKPETESESDGGAPPRLELVEQVDIPVSSDPNGPSEGTLRVRNEYGPHLADVLEERQDRVKIRTQVWPARVTGWVERRFTRPPPALSNVFGTGGLLGGLGMRNSGAGKSPWPRCGKPVALHLRSPQGTHEVGELRPHAAYEIQKQDSDWVDVNLPENAWIALQPGHGWAIRASDLPICQTPPEPKQSQNR